MTIRVLPREISERIAAGEVILRPSSLVKELIENSIDAGAEQISIEVERAGKSLIRVTDDGCGIPIEEISVAFEHHATSKVTSLDDLGRISSMGFRGEALPSIAAVSDVRIVSRASGADLGASLEVSHGTLGEVVEAGAPFGTTIEVRDLFKNFPARLKFLKSNRTEWGHISRVVTHAALSFPGIAFKVSHDGQVMISVERHSDRKMRIGGLFGTSLEDVLVSVSDQLGGVKVEGWIAPAEHTRSNASMIHVYVNNRFVRVPAVSHALKNAFGEYVPKGRCPIAFLFISVAPLAVDVNVHPAKEEVRFIDTGSVHDAVLAAVQETLSGRKPLPGRPYERPAPAQEWAGKPVADTAPGYTPPAAEQIPLVDVKLHEMPRFLQVHDTFIVIEDEDGVVLVDQHALHERVLLEELKEKVAEKAVEKQGLLVPMPVNLSPDEVVLLDEVKDCLEDVGMTVEDFGDNTVVVRSVPAIFRDVDPTDLLLEAIEGIKPGMDRESKLRDLIGNMACRGAVKAGDRLPEAQVGALVEKGRDFDFVGTCAHGRPTHAVITIAEMEKMFKRR